MKTRRWTFVALVPLAVFASMACLSPESSLGGRKSKKEAKKTARDLDLYTANLFHKRLSVISEEAFVAVAYQGPLAHTRKPAGAKLLETVDDHVRWAVIEVDEHGSTPGPIIFQIWVSLKKQPSTVATCLVNGKKLFLQVTDLRKQWTVDTELPGAKKGMTIRKLLERLGKRNR